MLHTSGQFFLVQITVITLAVTQWAMVFYLAKNAYTWKTRPVFRRAIFNFSAIILMISMVLQRVFYTKITGITPPEEYIKIEIVLLNSINLFIFFYFLLKSKRDSEMKD